VSQSNGDGGDASDASDGIDEGDERGANEPRAQDGFGDEGPGEGGKRRRRRRRRGRGGDRSEGGFDDRAPMDARPDGVPGAAPEARTGGPAGNASRFAGQRPDHRAPALRDDSDEWGEAATPSGAARSAPMKPAPAASTRDGASEPHAETGAETGAEPDGVEEADASAQDARSDDDGKPGRRRGRRGRRGGRGEDVRAELGDNAPAAREPKLIEPTMPVVNITETKVTEAKVTEAKLPEAKPAGAKAAEPKQAISPLARGVGPVPQAPASQTPAAAQPPRTLYAGRRGKAPPGKGPRRNEDR
jgi:ribonuclease E